MESYDLKAAAGEGARFLACVLLLYILLFFVL